MPRMNSVSTLSRTKSKKRGGSQERTGLVGLFRRKSSKSLSKRDISFPGTRASDSVPSMPSFPVPIGSSSMNNEHKYTPLKLDRDGQPLPRGPAPPRPARPDTMDLPGNVSIVDGFPAPQPPASEKRPSPTSSGQESRQDRGLNLATVRNSDASVYSTTMSTSPERLPSSGGGGLPQISENDDPVDDSESRNPPPSAWPRGRLRSMSRGDSNARPTLDPHPPLPRLATSQDQLSLISQHTPSESLSSDGSRLGFDERTDSSISSPPTSDASSLSQWKPSLEDQIAQLDQGSEFSSQHAHHPRRAANFSRPRFEQPTSPTQPGSRPANIPNLDSPTDPAIQNGRIIHDMVDTTIGPALSPPLSSPELVSPRTRIGEDGTVRRPEDWPPVPTTPDYPPTPDQRPSLARRKTSNTPKGPCKGCGLIITGRSMKAADGRLTGRYHRECKFLSQLTAILGRPCTNRTRFRL